MQKELQFWTRERKSYAQRISDERDVLSETATKADASLEEADEEIHSMAGLSIHIIHTPRFMKPPTPEPLTLVCFIPVYINAN